MSEEVERLSITRGDLVRGLESTVHSMVMRAKQDESGRFILEGPEETFHALQSDLSDEICYELSPPTRLNQLRKLYRRMIPDREF
jgi:hypothetical protein